MKLKNLETERFVRAIISAGLARTRYYKKFGHKRRRPPKGSWMCVLSVSNYDPVDLRRGRDRGVWSSNHKEIARLEIFEGLGFISGLRTDFMRGICGERPDETCASFFISQSQIKRLQKLLT
jgi:hypothetical protein